MESQIIYGCHWVGAGGTHHYLVAVDDGVQSVSNGKHRTLRKLLPDFLLY